MTSEPIDATHDAGESLLAILDELSRMVTQARSMPMSSSAIVNRAEVLDLIASARAVVPESIAAADTIVADADAVLERARTQAEEIVHDGEQQAARLVQDEPVLAQATEQARRIVAEAEDAAARRAADADSYAGQHLGRFEKELDALLQQVRAGREYLAGGAGLSRPGQGADDREGAERRDGGDRREQRSEHRPEHGRPESR
ncbi:hypothetical protein ACPYO6_00135 [Georgenia sp. Z1344]|uniref:hypothetical protein n=1 Tax=Georgenia sp. Z1344 TaxID=3416706 RepID=UPI003CEFC1D3